VLDRDGNVFTWGYGGNGRLGKAVQVDRVIPMLKVPGIMRCITRLKLHYDELLLGFAVKFK